MKKTFKPCDECGYSFLKQNSESGMCRICEFKKALSDVKTLSGMYEKLNSQEVSEYHRLKEYEDLEEQGKLMKRPCAVGDTVYTNCSTQGWYFRKEDRPYAAKIVFIGLNGIDDYINIDFGDGHMLQFKFSDIGKAVFLTREEAEAALKN